VSKTVSFLIAGLLIAASGGIARAQDEQPAVQTSGQSSTKPASAGQEGYGTTILVERETPIGLFITPWRDSTPEAEIDRPAKLLDEAMLPVDKDVFSRYIEYSAALARHRKVKADNKGATP